jgi:hypothetical protein
MDTFVRHFDATKQSLPGGFPPAANPEIEGIACFLDFALSTFPGFCEEPGEAA